MIMHRVYPHIVGQRAHQEVWLVDAPWAHPFWSQYAILLYDLTTDIPGRKPILYRQDVNWEFLVHALDPDFHLDELPDISIPAEGEKVHYLTPANYAYQFHAETPAEAHDYVQRAVDMINARQLSPDTDFRVQWQALFSDGYSLRRSDHMN